VIIANEYLSTICKIIVETVKTEKIYLFGSYAYGTPTPESDYDICVIVPDSNNRTIEITKAIRHALYPVQSTPLDVVVYHVSSFEKRKQAATMERKIAKEGILLYEQRELSKSITRDFNHGLLTSPPELSFRFLYPV